MEIIKQPLKFKWTLEIASASPKTYKSTFFISGLPKNTCQGSHIFVNQIFYQMMGILSTTQAVIQESLEIFT